MNTEQKIAHGAHAGEAAFAAWPHGAVCARRLHKPFAQHTAVMPAGCIFAGLPAYKLPRLQTLRGGHQPPL